jgi:hypothetical protein
MKYPELVPEFATTTTLVFSSQDWESKRFARGDKLSEGKAKSLGLPFAARVLDVDSSENGVMRVSVKFGMFHTCEEFIAKARLDGHSSIDDDLLCAVFALFTKGPAAVEAEWEEAFNYYEYIAERDRQCEEEIHAQLSSAREAIMRYKKFMLFTAMCTDAGIKDTLLAAHYPAGVSLVGEAATSPSSRRSAER